MLSVFNSIRVGKTGTTSLELALVLGLFLTLLLGTTDIVRYIIADQALLTLMHSAERSLLLQNSLSLLGNNVSAACPDTSDVVLNITQITPFLDPRQVSLVCTPINNSSAIVTAQITATYPFTPLVPLLDNLVSTTITESATFTY